MMKFRSARILDHLLRLKKGRHISPVQCKFCGAHSSSRPTASAALPTEFSSGNGGFFAGLASSPVVHAAEVLFSSVHSLSHLPWWAVIVVSTFSLRAFATLPLAVHQANLVCRIELLLPTVKELQEAVKHRVITECKREHLPVEEANRRMMKEVCVCFWVWQTIRHLMLHHGYWFCYVYVQSYGRFYMYSLWSDVARPILAVTDVTVIKMENRIWAMYARLLSLCHALHSAFLLSRLADPIFALPRHPSLYLNSFVCK